MNRLFLLALVLLLGASALSSAQCDTNQIADFFAIPEGGFDTIQGWEIRPGFGFEMHYDSGHTMYRATEFFLNGTRLWLYGWCEGKTIRDLGESALADSTRTIAFTVHTGDSIVFYRELAWFSPITLEQTPTNYYALDSLDYSVELVKVSTGVRRALLDSIGVTRRIPSGAPTIHGPRPIIAHVLYIVPAALNNDTVFIRVRPTARGGGLYNFVRTDRWGFRLTERLSSSVWQQYILYNTGG